VSGKGYYSKGRHYGEQPYSHTGAEENSFKSDPGSTYNRQFEATLPQNMGAVVANTYVDSYYQQRKIGGQPHERSPLPPHPGRYYHWQRDQEEEQ
jgi:hypothetical protein